MREGPAGQQPPTVCRSGASSRAVPSWPKLTLIKSITSVTGKCWSARAASTELSSPPLNKIPKRLPCVGIGISSNKRRHTPNSTFHRQTEVEAQCSHGLKVRPRVSKCKPQPFGSREEPSAGVLWAPGGHLKFGSRLVQVHRINASRPKLSPGELGLRKSDGRQNKEGRLWLIEVDQAPAATRVT